MATLTTFTEANYFAFKAHEGQLRKGKLKLPYICHPLEVVNILARTGYVDDYKVLAAAVLHDVVEDCDVKLEVIEALFGSEVAALVDTLTFPAGFSKAAKIALAPTFGPDACAIKTADLISNINSITEDPTSMADFDAIRFVKYAKAMHDAFQFHNSTLNREFTLAVIRFNIVFNPKEI